MVCPPRVHSGRRGRHGGLLRGRGSQEMARSLRCPPCAINVLVGTQVSSLGMGSCYKENKPSPPLSLPSCLM